MYPSATTPFLKTFIFVWQGPFAQDIKRPQWNPRRGTSQAPLLASAVKTAQDQTTAPKPPLVPGSDFSSSSLLVVGTLQYHLEGSSRSSFCQTGTGGGMLQRSPCTLQRCFQMRLTSACWLTSSCLRTSKPNLRVEVWV